MPRRGRFWLAAAMAIGLGFVLFLACGQTNVPPPVIPHPPYAELCVDCHRSGKGGAPIQRHPDRGGCTNCHRFRR